MDEVRTIWLMTLLWKKEGLMNPTRKPAEAGTDRWSPGFWEPVLTFTEASGQHALRVLCVSPSQPGLRLDLPASLLSSSLLFPPCTISEDSSLFIFMGTQDGWREALFPLKMFLINALILSRYKSQSSPFSPSQLSLEADSIQDSGCLTRNWVRGGDWEDRWEPLGGKSQS